MRTGLRFDGIYWQLKHQYSESETPLTQIVNRWVWSLDDFSNDSYIPDFFRIGWLGVVWDGLRNGGNFSGLSYVDQPAVSPGELSFWPDSNHINRGCWNFGERVMNLDFRRRPMTVIQGQGYSIQDISGQILHFEHTHN